MGHFRRRLALMVFAIAAMLVTLGGGTLGFVLIEHYSVFDAFYMTLITVTTVGYEELHPLSFYGRIFNSFLIFFGVTMLLLAVGGMTQVIIELELTQYFGKRRTRKMIEKLQDHIIVCGFGLGCAAALFSGDLAMRALAGARLFPFAAPIGGTAMLLFWLAIAVIFAAGALRRD